MLVLALESSTDKTTVAIGRKGNILNEKQIHSRRYSETIMTIIDELLKAESISLNEIDGFAVGIGPGSFTGIRAGIVTIKTLSQVLRKPSIGISSALSVANSAWEDLPAKKFSKIVVLMDARRNQYYLAEYDISGGRLDEVKTTLFPEDHIGEALKTLDPKKTILTGNALSLFTDEIKAQKFELSSQENWIPVASQLIKLSHEKLKTLKWENLFTLSPIYWRPSDALTLKERLRK